MAFLVTPIYDILVDANAVVAMLRIPAISLYNMSQVTLAIRTHGFQ